MTEHGDAAHDAAGISRHGEAAHPGQPSASVGAAPDPFKGLRGVMAATLILEAIVVALALPVVAKLGAGISTTGGILVIILAVAMILACGFLKRPWGLWLALGLQVVMILCGFVVFALGVLGVIFGLVWLYILWIRRDVTRRMAAHTPPG